jgi:hypothetical protein
MLQGWQQSQNTELFDAQLSIFGRHVIEVALAMRDGLLAVCFCAIEKNPLDASR